MRWTNQTCCIKLDLFAKFQLIFFDRGFFLSCVWESTTCFEVFFSVSAAAAPIKINILKYKLNAFILMQSILQIHLHTQVKKI